MKNVLQKKDSRRRTLTWNDKMLAERIKELRRKNGLTQEELSEMIEMNHSYIAYIENGQRGLSLPVLYKIAKALKVKVGELITF